MKEELIKYVMSQADKCYADDFPINQIEDWIRDFYKKYENVQQCRFCLNIESILTAETCCTGCSKLK